MSNAYEQYQRLVARVDTFGQTIGQRYPTQITCQAGCDGCCYQQFTVFPIEAQHLAQAVTDLAPEMRQHLLARLQPTDPWRIIDTAAPCVLLEHGRCSLYTHRPLICRMHGFPIASTMIEPEASLTWAMLPGAEGIVEENIVCTESITSRPGLIFLM